jgi:LysW-gamma-L-lysine carboxypeptidase
VSKELNPLPETILGLVKAYSPSGHEGPAVDFLVGRMQALHFTRSFADEAGNAVGVMGEGPRQIVLLGHIDTVPGEIPVRVENATQGAPVLYGRGSVDAKGPLAAFTDAVAAAGPVDGWQFVVIGAVGEEQDSPGAQFVTPLYHPEFAIIGEPSRWERVTLGYKGSAWSKITVRRSLKHTAGQGESACEAAARVWEALRAWAAAFNADRPRAFDQVLPTLRGLNSGGDGFEEWASLQVGTRLPVDLPPESWYALLNQIPGVCETPGLTIERNGFPIPAYQGEKNTPLVRAFLAGIRAAGGQPGFVLKTGTADLNIVAPAWGCPALAYGPGDSSLDHTPDEHLELQEYQRAANVVMSVLNRLCQNP